MPAGMLNACRMEDIEVLAPGFQTPIGAVDLGGCKFVGVRSNGSGGSECALDLVDIMSGEVLDTAYPQPHVFSYFDDVREGHVAGPSSANQFGARVGNKAVMAGIHPDFWLEVTVAWEDSGTLRYKNTKLETMNEQFSDNPQVILWERGLIGPTVIARDDTTCYVIMGGNGNISGNTNPQYTVVWTLQINADGSLKVLDRNIALAEKSTYPNTATFPGWWVFHPIWRRETDKVPFIGFTLHSTTTGDANHTIHYLNLPSGEWDDWEVVATPIGPPSPGYPPDPYGDTYFQPPDPWPELALPFDRDKFLLVGSGIQPQNFNLPEDYKLWHDGVRCLAYDSAVGPGTPRWETPWGEEHASLFRGMWGYGPSTARNAYMTITTRSGWRRGGQEPLGTFGFYTVWPPTDTPIEHHQFLVEFEVRDNKVTEIRWEDIEHNNDGFIVSNIGQMLSPLGETRMVAMLQHLNDDGDIVMRYLVYDLNNAQLGPVKFVVDFDTAPIGPQDLA